MIAIHRGRARILLTVCTVLVLMSPATAKRKPPEPVPPVVSGEVRYTVEGSGREQRIAATSTRSGAVLWRALVFRTTIQPKLEEDVQWIFINQMTLAGRTLLIQDERARCYALNLDSQQVKRRSCPE
jgi:hypothetical protein